MRKLILAAPLAALALSGCATGPSWAERMSAYVGRPESVLVAGMGVPDKRISVGGLAYFAYVRKSFHYVGGGGFGPSPFFYGFGPGYYGSWGGFPAQAYTDECTTTFALKNQTVQSFTLRGNDC